MTTLSPFHQVGEFHEVFGHPKTTEPQVNIFNDNPEMVAFRFSLINEEINEFEEACKKKDVVEAVDALCDTLYVIYGACHVFGLTDIDHIGLCELDDNEPSHDTVKNANEWFEKNAEEVNKAVKDLNTLLTTLVTNVETDDLMKMYDILKQMTVKLYETGFLFNTDMYGAFSEVHRSNMTKVCTTKENAKATVEWYKENDKRHEPAYRLSLDKYWVVYNSKTTKILKSIFFELPKLEQFIH